MAAKAPKDYAGATDQGNNAGLADADLQLKKRARRRLVGAIALALFAIIVLPVVMDHEPAPVVPDIQVRIPNSDGTDAQAKLALKPLNAAANTAKSDAPTASAPAVVTAAEALGATKPTEPVATGTGNDTKPAEKERAAVQEPPASKVKPAAGKEDTAKEAVKEPVKDAASVSAATNGKWVVQLGAYQSSGNVAVLMAKLKEIRMPAYTEKFDSPQGPRTRVRAGPFASKEAALAAQKRIKIINVDGPVAPMSAK